MLLFEQPQQVHDVAKYILEKSGQRMTTMKLQKLCYYSQAWHYTWTGKRLFHQQVQAWANGPVCRELFSAHKGRYVIDAASFRPGDPGKLSRDQKTTIDKVLEAYLPLTGAQLSAITHDEQPWQSARGALPLSAKCTAEITLDSMRSYYGALSEDDPDVSAVADAADLERVALDW